MPKTQEVPSAVRDSSKSLFPANQWQTMKCKLYANMVCLLGISEKAAVKITEAAVTDYIAATRESQIAGKFGKAKDGKMDYSGAFKSKKAGATAASQIAHVCQFIDDIGEHGISYGKTEWALTLDLSAYVAEVESVTTP